MPFLIGTDEAGYGPNLGPLTVTGTLWTTSGQEVDLYSQLSNIVSSDAPNDATRSMVQVADSKKIYQSSGSIRNLETSVLSLLFSLTGKVPKNWRHLLDLICTQESLDFLPPQDWLQHSTLNLPVRAEKDHIQKLGEQFRTNSEIAGVKLMEIRCVPIFPGLFNSLVEQFGNKATLLSIETLKIVRQLMDLTNDDLEIGCDKHGGRSKYAALIQEILTESLVVVGTESSQTSDYSFRDQERDVTIRFQAKGESFLPTALSSMVAKYLREIFMMIWNDYWVARIPNIKPTKGYPVDARRFASDINLERVKLGIDKRSIWRNR